MPTAEKKKKLFDIGILLTLLIIVFGMAYFFFGFQRGIDASQDAKIEKSVTREQYNIDMTDIKKQLSYIVDRIDRALNQ